MWDSIVGRGARACNPRIFPFPIAPLNKIITRFLPNREIPGPGTEQLRVKEDPFRDISTVSLERKRQAKETRKKY